MKLVYKWGELYEMLKKAVISILSGLFVVVRAVILLVINFAIKGFKTVVSWIRGNPCVAVGLTFIIKLAFAIGVHMNMKVKLTTTEWQRDSLSQRLDSAKMTYYRYQPYKE